MSFARPLRSLAFSTFLLSFSAFASDLDTGWTAPPPAARVRAYWWWLNGNVDKAAITRDLEQMQAKGFGGALICDADGSSQEGNAHAPHGPTFFTPEWRELYKHTLREASRLGLEISLNIQSGWNLGGPMITAEDAAKKLAWSQGVARGPAHVELALPEPKHRDSYYRDLFVVAYRARPGAKTAHRPIQNLAEKAMLKTLHFSAPDTSPLLSDLASQPGEEDTTAAAVVDLSSKMDAKGVLHWDAPEGDWELIRFGCTVGDQSKVSTSSEGWSGYALDVLDERAFRRYWDAVIEPLIADAGPLAGKTLKYLHTDSWEVEAINWTPTLRKEFKQRRGYDMLPWLPVMAGRIVNSREESNRFLDDFRKTLGDLAIEHHFKPFAQWAHRRGLQIHPEAGGPHAVPIDAQRCLGMDDAPMSEFWAWSWTHRVGDSNRFFVKQPASAAHTYGKPLVLAEGFTTIGPHWQETLWDNLKPAFDHACTEGLNRLVWHAFVCSPASEGLPGQQYFAGTHLNPEVTWWEKSAPFFSYLNRCQFMLQRGLPVADALYYYGDHVPNFAQIRSSDPAHLGPGYDYDVITEEALLDRVAVKGGRLVLPEGTSYRILVLPDRPAISLPVLRKIEKLAARGATIVGPKPSHATGLANFQKNDRAVGRIADELWTGRIKGRVITGKAARDVLLGDAVKPDFEFMGGGGDTVIDYIHRQDAGTEIFFVANRGLRAESVSCVFRVSGQGPELWDAVTGERRFATEYHDKEGRTTVPIDFAPCGSMFVVFRESARAHPATPRPNSYRFVARQELAGPWTVAFDPKWGGPARAEFPNLTNWTSRTEPGIKYYSGTAIYRTTFERASMADLPSSIYLDLGIVHEIAEVRLNGKPLGILWSPPFRVDITAALKPGSNDLEVEVVNFWPNRIIGDQFLPPDQRLTRTNIRKLTKDTKLMDSGLLGPVRLMERQ